MQPMDKYERRVWFLVYLSYVLGFMFGRWSKH